MPLRLIKLVISLSVAFADWVSAAITPLLGGRQTGECVVLYYHAIRAAARRQFASQMDELARLSVPVDIEARGPMPKGRRYSAVTFDDGFMSVVENALPELRARQIPCTIFVPTGSIGRHPSWIGPSHRDAAEVVAPAEVLRTIADQPLVRIGSHSVSHPDFRRLDDMQARAELTGSKVALEDILGRAVTSFSFPHGAYTERSLDLAKECGYSRAFTIEPLPLKDPCERFSIGRVRVEPHDWPIEFRLKALGAYRWMARASAIKRDLLGIVRRGRVQVSQPGQGL
jgi:peptidoglycan/xylan/chitin deacetylase (PgdA/CDA1 family)